MKPAGALPLQPQERLVSLDVLRAFALLGILVMNMWDFAYSGAVEPMYQRWPAWWDRAAGWTSDALFSGKFNSLFSFLFGIGFYLQLQRLASRHVSATAIYVRRLAVLFTLGALHAVFVWWGDVLHVYAVLGLVLLLVRKASDRVVLAVMLACLLAGPAVNGYSLLTRTPEEAARRRAQAETRIEAANRAIAGGRYWEATRQRIDAHHRFYIREPRFAFGVYTTFFTTMLLGFWVARAGYLRQTAIRRPLLKKTFVWCLAGGLACGVALALSGVYIRPFQDYPLRAFTVLVYSLGRPPLMLAYAIGIVLLLDAGWFARLFRALTFAGRMPLTNYLLQSAVCTMLFYGYGAGLVDRVSPAVAFLLSLGIWSAQVALSVLWFRYFSFGPLEWLWRLLAYGGVAEPEKERVGAPALS